MASLRRVSKRRSRKRDLQESSSTCPNTLSSRRRELSSLYERQLASPPASSGCAIPSSSSDVESCHHGISEGSMKDEENEEDGEGEDETGHGSMKQMEPSTSSPSPQVLRRAVFEPSANSKRLSLSEKVKLLKICSKHGSQFLHCPTSGKDAEEEVWTSIMEEFSTTVRSGVFIKYSEVKKVASKICRNRRKNTKGNIPPERRSRMGDLDTWIDRWVRIWKCRDLVVNIANAHQSIRETIGEKKFKRIFHHRVDGDELPQDLGRLTLSPPLWKAIQKRFRKEERSLGSRHVSLFPGGDESDWTDEEETEDDAMEEADDEGLPMKSIEEESQNSSSEAPEDIVSTPNREAESELDFPNPTPRTQARLDQFERGYTNILKEEQGRTGKKTSVLGLAQERQEEERQASASSKLEEVLASGAAQPQLKEKGLTNTQYRGLASSSSEVEDKAGDGLTSLSVERSTPVPGAADVQRSAGNNSIRSQRLEPGTYCPNKDVQVGFHGRQVILAGKNDTAAQDYRQVIYAKIDVSGRVRLHLRAQNLQGKEVPPDFRLMATVSLSRKNKDIIYLPKFHDMSHDEVRREVARQSLLPVNQRICHDWVPTPAAENCDREEDESTLVPKSQGKESHKGVGANDDAAGTSRKNCSEMEGNETATPRNRGSDPQASTRNGRESLKTTPDVSVPTEMRKFVLSELPAKQSAQDYSVKAVGAQSDLSNGKPQKTNPDRTGTPDVLRTFLAEEARKQQKPLAPHRIPHHSSPPRRLNPQGRTSNKNRITPSRFYGAESSGHNVVQDGRQISGPPEQNSLRQLRSGFDSEAGLSERSTISPRLNYKPQNILPVQDCSDNDSLPDIEELHRRRVQAAKAPTSPENSRQHRDSRDPKSCIAGKVTDALASRHQGSDHPSTQRDTSICQPENMGIWLKGTENHQKPANDGPQRQRDKAITPSGSYSRKRGRCDFMTNTSANSSSNPDIGSFKPPTAPKALSVDTSTSNEHFAKRQRPPPPSEHVQTPIPVPDLTHYGLKPFWRPSTQSAVHDDGVLDKQQGHPSGGSLDKGKGKVTQARTQNKNLASDPRSSNGNGYTPKWKTGTKNNTSSRRFYPYGQPGGSSGPATLQNRRKNGGRGKRDRYRGKDHHDRASGGSHSNNNNRFLREVTTDTVDFENFSPDMKCDVLHRKLSRMEEKLRKIEKD